MTIKFSIIQVNIGIDVIIFILKKYNIFIKITIMIFVIIFPFAE